ncbi:hypothetical protein Syun_009082 [Stephania yunnanensis]|uniref:Uncharacterized protein n=1 Tax=Stephania yunnanensis TaxID=152371 RepID=A0AAP0PN60_9MAGN
MARPTPMVEDSVDGPFTRSPPFVSLSLLSSPSLKPLFSFFPSSSSSLFTFLFLEKIW